MRSFTVAEPGSWPGVSASLPVRMLLHLICLTMLVLCVLAQGGAVASAAVEPVRRDIIAISNGAQFGFSERLIESRRVAEMPLNHLGLRVQHHDWHADLEPDTGLAERARGALVWLYGTSMREPDRFLSWAINFMNDGGYLVLAGEQAYLMDLELRAADPGLVKRFHDRLGVRYRDALLDDFDPLVISTLDTDMMNYERDVEVYLEPVPELRASDEAGVYLSLSDSSGRRSDLVARTRGGGLMLRGYGYRAYDDAGVDFWLLNPFRFFDATFRTAGLPKPDITTLVGRRMYFSHIDGDGWNSVSHVADADGVLRLSATIMQKHLIEPYPDLPVTIGPVSADLDFMGNPAGRLAARELFALPQVELGTHTHTHPFDWNFYKPGTYDHRTEEYLFRGASRQRSRIEKALSGAGAAGDPENLPDGYGSFNTEHYTRPRAYYDGEYDTAREIDLSVEIIERYAPAGKRVEVVQWSGNTLAYEEILAHVRERGLENINGGDSRYDDRHPSLSWLSPWSRRVGGELQVHTAMANEAVYTNDWTERFYGYRDVIQTIDRTESPIRLKPINLYYHTYSAERENALQAVRDALEHVRTQEVAPVSTSHFVRLVRGALSMELIPIEGGWRILERGDNNTVRLDAAEGIGVDYLRSVGVIGHRYHQGSVYIALDPAVSDVRLIVNDDGKGQGRSAARRVSRRTGIPAYLQDSRWRVSDVQSSARDVAFSVQGYGGGESRWRFGEAVSCRALATYTDGEEVRSLLRSDAEGLVTHTLEKAPVAGARIELHCDVEAG